MNRNTPSIRHLQYSDGIVIYSTTTEGRFRKLIDLWLRLKFVFAYISGAIKSHKRPFRFSSAVRSAAVIACTFATKCGHTEASASGPTNNVGNDGDKSDSPA